MIMLTRRGQEVTFWSFVTGQYPGISSGHCLILTAIICGVSLCVTESGPVPVVQCDCCVCNSVSRALLYRQGQYRLTYVQGSTVQTGTVQVDLCPGLYCPDRGSTC